MKAEDLLTTEYKRFSELREKNEEAGERRISFLITLVSAVITALIALWSKTGDIAAAGALLGGLLLFGEVTFLRMVHRDRVTKEYTGILDYLRAKLLQQIPETELGEYALPFGKKRAVWKQGGLAVTAALVNCLTAALIGWLPFGPAGGVATFVLMVVAHGMWLQPWKGGSAAAH